MADPTDAAEADTQLAPAGVMLGAYLLERRIGQGGMGSVYRARDTRSDRIVAVKVLKEKDPELVRRFLREARIAAGLRHPNIVEVHEIATRPGEPPAIVMELLTGESLSAHLARVGRLSVEEVAPIVVAVVRAVQAVHAQGVVHRDLKPDNVFLARGGGSDGAGIVVKVLDFGIAKLTPASDEALDTGSALTRTGQILGTPQYMAPEVIFGEKDIDARADVWSLGVILYEALAGARPFDGQNVGQVFKAIALEPPVPLSTRAPLVPPSVAALVERMLAHARAERLHDIGEVLEVLAPFLGPDAIAASVPPPRAHAQALAPRRRSGRGLVVGVVVVAACAAGAAFGLSSVRATDPPVARAADPGPPASAPPPVPQRASSPPLPSEPASSVVAPPASPSAPASLARAAPPAPRSVAAAQASASPPAPAASSPLTKHRSGTLQPDEL